METSESIKNISAALLKFDVQVKTITKDSNNPFFKSKYASLANILDVIREPLINSGLIVKQFPENRNCLTTIVVHVDSGEFFRATYEMEPTKKDPQGVGSCISYMRRYALGPVLGLNIDEDDDGNLASKAVKPMQKSNAISPGGHKVLTKCSKQGQELQEIFSSDYNWILEIMDDEKKRKLMDKRDQEAISKYHDEVFEKDLSR